MAKGARMVLAGMAGKAAWAAAPGGSAAAARRPVVAVRSFENERGVTAPFGRKGTKFWDPIGLASDGDAAAFRRRRMSEIKNGRVARLACLGWIVPEYWRFPGYLSPSQGLRFEDVPSGFAALAKVPAAGWAQIALFVATLELFGMKQEEGREPGDFKSFGWLGLPFWGASTPEKRDKGLDSEINNGRLAMVAISGMAVQSMFFGNTTGPEMWLPGAAFENELGVQPPVGFWDPLGFTKDGNVDNFRRRRAVELKHGRLAMFAATGYIVPEYYKWPGYISCEGEMKFEDIPHGLGAITKVPILGWLQIGLFIGHYEGYLMRQDPNRPPGDFFRFGFLGTGILGGPYNITDPEAKKQKLAAELANGRLAMFAIMAMLFQNGTVGTTGPEMWLPPSAFENELGVQPPVGFWDPLGFTKDGNVDNFRRRRAVELKHGRLSMFAAVGYIVPEYYKWPGYISPSQEIKFEDIPHGLGAITKVPILGWLQIGLFIGHYE